MQKKLIALAVTGLLSTGAYAQSSAVTVYGVADLSFDVVKTSGGPAGAQTGSFTRVSSNSSYIGFKGTEDLGNGLKALFQFETGVNADQGGLFTGAAKRDTFVGLSGNFGTVKLGELTTATRALGLAMDVNAGASGIGDNKALLSSGRIGVTDFDARQANTIQYVTPSVAGFNASLAYISGENKSAKGVAGTAAQRNTNGFDLGLNYNSGPILVGLAYAQEKDKDILDSKARNMRVAGAYDFGVASVRLIWDSVKDKNNTGLSVKQNVWGLGGTYNVVPNGKLIAQYYKAQDIKTNAGKISDTGAKMFEIGYEHSLSKRTMLKLVYARINNDYDATTGVGGGFDFYNNGTGRVGPFSGIDPSGFQVGIRHSF